MFAEYTMVRQSDSSRASSARTSLLVSVWSGALERSQSTTARMGRAEAALLRSAADGMRGAAGGQRVEALAREVSAQLLECLGVILEDQHLGVGAHQLFPGDQACTTAGAGHAQRHLVRRQRRIDAAKVLRRREDG